jgi:hypothetical protein
MTRMWFCIYLICATYSTHNLLLEEIKTNQKMYSCKLKNN